MSEKFHLALPCLEVAATKEFYTQVLGAKVGREKENWIDIDLFGHQLTFSEVKDYQISVPNYRFEDSVIPSFHFGIILNKDDWNNLKTQLRNQKSQFEIDSSFLKKKAGEHHSFMLKDPSGYYVEFKLFERTQEVFATS